VRHELVVSDLSPDAVKGLVGDGAVGSASLDEFVGKLKAPRAAWIMVPAGDPTEKNSAALADRMQSGDTIIDGGKFLYSRTISARGPTEIQRHKLRRRGHERPACGASIAATA